MRSLLEIVERKVEDSARCIFPKLEDFPSEVFPSPREFGHYQCNSSLKLSKVFKKSPREIAQKIVEHLDLLDRDGEKVFLKVEVAGPGFINFTFDKNFLSKELERMFLDPYLGADPAGVKKKIVIDFSSPNVAKDLHVGHLRSTIIGDCLARLFEFLGYDVLRLNHIGDWGTQFGMLIAYMKEKEGDVLEGKKEVDVFSLVNWYKAAKKLFDEERNFSGRAKREVVALQSGNKDSLDAWKKICEISKRSYLKIYDLLGVRLKDRGESFYNKMLGEVVLDLSKKGLITVSDGAKCIFLEGFKGRDGKEVPYMVQKSDGGFTYDTTDIAAMRHRIEVEKADRIIIVTDAGQSLHFKMLYAASVKAGYLDPKKVRFDHVAFGVVLGKDGKKFKTREGEVERLIDLLKGAITRAREMILKRNPEIDKKELEKLSRVLGISAVKYADLSCHRQKDYQFSYDRMLRFEGNTAIFLLYSYVRIMGIKRNIEGDVSKILKESKIELEHPSEVELGFHLRRFGEVLSNLERDLLPNRLADYLYLLAEKFNAFFRDCHVVGEKEQNSRLKLSELAAFVLKRGLYILGIETVERM